jgi:hypothetical protein
MRFISRSGILSRKPKSNHVVTIYALIFSSIPLFYIKIDIRFLTLAIDQRQEYIFCRIGICRKTYDGHNN